MQGNLGFCYLEGIAEVKGSTLANVKAVAVFQRSAFQQCVSVFIAKMGNIDHSERIGGLDDKFESGLFFGK